eukprot:TRINITY_DN34610_c0_g1_i1.p1 TRINITY_DN34610_c0_g1~~TRINITY_DN34610_c0_g1_i1.p1  ORF type:complete len:679 (-),score=159.90 TRINITY_DN34610_c0_g1_i1:252-2288(-)
MATRLSVLLLSAYTASCHRAPSNDRPQVTGSSLLQHSRSRTKSLSEESVPHGQRQASNLAESRLAKTLDPDAVSSVSSKLASAGKKLGSGHGGSSGHAQPDAHSSTGNSGADQPEAHGGGASNHSGAGGGGAHNATEPGSASNSSAAPAEGGNQSSQPATEEEPIPEEKPADHPSSNGTTPAATNESSNTPHVTPTPEDAAHGNSSHNSMPSGGEHAGESTAGGHGESHNNGTEETAEPSHGENGTTPTDAGEHTSPNGSHGTPEEGPEESGHGNGSHATPEEGGSHGTPEEEPEEAGHGGDETEPGPEDNSSSTEGHGEPEEGGEEVPEEGPEETGHSGNASTEGEPEEHAHVHVNFTAPPVNMVPASNLMTVDVVVNTSKAIQTAGSTTGASFAFMVDGAWTDDALLFEQAELGESLIKQVRLPMWPSHMRVKALGADAWLMHSIELKTPVSNGAPTVVKVLDANSVGNQSTEATELHSDSRFWLDGDELGPLENVYDVPALSNATSDAGTEAAGHADCVTRHDSRLEAFGYTTSPPGTKCVFGVDPRDEGAHCIEDDGTYGSYGWCYTKHDQSSWGACSPSCPLWGQQKLLGDKLDAVLRRMDAKAAEEAHDFVGDNVTAAIAKAAKAAQEAARIAAQQVIQAQKALTDAQAEQAHADTEAEGLSHILHPEVSTR